MILEAAMRLFDQNGPAKTTVARIAREAHVAVGSVYLEFSSKEDLLGALSSRAHRRILRVERDALEGEGDAVHRLRAALTARFEAFEEIVQGRHGPDLLHCSECAAIRSAHQNFRGEERALFDRFLRDAAERGELQFQDAGALLAAYAELSPPLLDRRTDGALLRKRLEAIHALVFSGLTPRS